MFIASFLVTKRPDLSYEAFRSHQTEVHIPMVRKIPGLRRYIVAFHPPSAEGSAQAHALAAHLFFDDAEAFQTAMQSPEAQEAIADQPNMNDIPKTVMLTGEAHDFPELA
ncbi:MAG: EthD family reductase [Myxococcota bacterium]